jgi:hypothetical protein
MLNVASASAALMEYRKQRGALLAALVAAVLHCCCEGKLLMMLNTVVRAPGRRCRGRCSKRVTRTWQQGVELLEIRASITIALPVQLSRLKTSLFLLP